MRVSVIENGIVVNIIEASSVEHASLYYPGCREARDDDTIASAPPDPDAALRAQFEAEQQAKQAAEFDAYKARAGQPSYKAAAVKIAAEKLGILDAIDAAIMALVDKAGDKALLVWWIETDAISRGDAQWQEIEAGMTWDKVSAADLFDLAAQV